MNRGLSLTVEQESCHPLSSSSIYSLTLSPLSFTSFVFCISLSLRLSFSQSLLSLRLASSTDPVLSFPLWNIDSGLSLTRSATSLHLCLFSPHVPICDESANQTRIKTPFVCMCVCVCFTSLLTAAHMTLQPKVCVNEHKSHHPWQTPLVFQSGTPYHNTFSPLWSPKTDNHVSMNISQHSWLLLTKV